MIGFQNSIPKQRLILKILGIMPVSSNLFRQVKVKSVRRKITRQKNCRN